MPGETLHATALLVARRGVLVTGPSGAGKSSLAARIIAHEREAGRFAALISDDRTELVALSGRLIARAPRSLAGAIELHHLGIADAPAAPAGVIDLVVELVERVDLPRMAEPMSLTLYGVTLPRIALPARDSAMARMLLAAVLPVANPYTLRCE